MRHEAKCKEVKESWKCVKYSKLFEYESYLNRHNCSNRCEHCHKKINDGEEHQCVLKVDIFPTKSKKVKKNNHC